MSMQFFYTVNAIKQVMNNEGSHYWSRAACKSFGSRVLDRVYGGRVFVESVRMDETRPRWYSVKCLEWHEKYGYQVVTIGELMTTTNVERAKQAAEALGDLCATDQVPEYMEYGVSDALAKRIGFTNEEAESE